MQKLRRLLPKTLSFRLMLIFFITTIIPFIFISTVTLTRVSDAMEEDAKTRISQMIHLVGNNLDSRIQSITAITERMYLYRTTLNGVTVSLEDMMASPSGGASLIKQYVSATLDSNSFLQNVLFIDMVNDEVHARGVPATKNLATGYDVLALTFVQEALTRPRRLTISDPHTEDYFFRSTAPVISFCRPLLSLNHLPEREVVLGVMMLDVDYGVFEDAFNAYNWADAGQLYVVNEDDLIIYASDSSLIGQTHVRPNAGHVTVLEEAIPAASWRICYHLDHPLLLQDLNALQRSLLLITLIALAVMILSTILSSRYVARPVKHILDQMKRVRAGDLSARVPVYDDDEMGRLSNGFNQMVSELDEHIQRSYVASIQQKEAELEALKMQIHPHFLYNTLEVMRMSSLAHQDADTARMTLSLVRQLQYVIGERHERVPLKTELNMIREYVSLVSLRYGEMALKIDFPAELAQCAILKMSLQPIVENAVQHGLRPLGGGQISISASRSGSTLRITVMDNGKGMDAQALADLRQKLAGDAAPQQLSDGSRSIGMKNVHDRIRLACGAAYGLEVESASGVGTAVVLCLPYEITEDCHETPDC